MRVRAQDNGIRPNSGYMDLSITVQNTEDDDGNPKWFKPRNREIIKAPEVGPTTTSLHIQPIIKPYVCGIYTYIYIDR